MQKSCYAFMEKNSTLLKEFHDDSSLCCQAIAICCFQSLSSHDSRSNGLQYLPSLKSIEIRDCPNLIGWATTRSELPLLPRVSRLCIRKCPKLEIVPHFLIHFEEVQLEYVSIALLSELGESFSPPDSPAQYHFHSLTLAEIDHPTILLPQGRFLQRLTCLQRLLIYGCNHLATLSLDILERLPSLQKLSIVFCESLEFEDYDYGHDDDISLPVLPSLHHFYLRKLPKLVTLPKWLQHSFNMQQLDIYDCHNLKCLPSWLTKLNALESLEVWNSDLVYERCRSNTAQDWPNIAHIPNIKFQFTTLQQGGLYLGATQGEEEEEEDVFYPKLPLTLLHSTLGGVQLICWR